MASGGRGRAQEEASRKATFEARVPDAAALPLLDAFASLWGRAERWLDQRAFTGRTMAPVAECNAARRECRGRFGLTARQVGSAWFDLQARVASAKGSQKRHLSTLGTMIENLKMRIAKGAKHLKAARRRKPARVHDEGIKRSAPPPRITAIRSPARVQRRPTPSRLPPPGQVRIRHEPGDWTRIRFSFQKATAIATHLRLGVAAYACHDGMRPGAGSSRAGIGTGRGDVFCGVHPRSWPSCSWR